MFTHTYIVLLVSGLAHNRNDCVVQEQTHGEDSGKSVRFYPEHGYVQFGLGVAEVGVDAPREGKVQHNPYQSHVAEGADGVDLPESRGVDQSEEGQEDKGVYEKERLLTKDHLEYGVVRFFLLK